MHLRDAGLVRPGAPPLGLLAAQLAQHGGADQFLLAQSGGNGAFRDHSGASLASRVSRISCATWQGKEHPDGRTRCLRRRQGPGDDARQSGLPQPAGRTDPLCADHRKSAGDAHRHRHAVDQQVLHPRPESPRRAWSSTSPTRVSRCSSRVGRTPTPKCPMCASTTTCWKASMKWCAWRRRVLQGAQGASGRLLHRRHAGGHLHGLGQQALRRRQRAGGTLDVADHADRFFASRRHRRLH